MRKKILQLVLMLAIIAGNVLVATKAYAYIPDDGIQETTCYERMYRCNGEITWTCYSVKTCQGCILYANGCYFCSGNGSGLPTE